MQALAQARIGQVAIVCQDVARAKAFYKDTLGVRHLFDAGPTLAFFDCGGTRLMLSPAEGEARGTSVLYYFVPDIEVATKELARKGVAFVGDPHLVAKMPDHELWLCAFSDTEGNMLGIMEERR